MSGRSLGVDLPIVVRVMFLRQLAFRQCLLARGWVLGGRNALACAAGIRWLNRSAASGYPGGAYEFSRFYASQGDRKQADLWQAKAKDMEAARGSFADAVAFAYSGKTRESPREVYNRGYRILAGQEPGTFDQAVELVRAAAYQQVKEDEAQFGLMYLHGAGMPQDTVEAIYWFRRAALHGSPEAKRLLEDALAKQQGK